ncbi:MAG TPA: 6,7-dimethyl-8-ribityllumazine synthase [Candidatus Binataceae bacterium]|nr:6,7-dimethyl-8-ribityllumazine synthase [Candidatus Binataceae bacterium]
MKIAIVVADFNSEVTHPMLKRALEHATSLAAEITHTEHVFGIYDMPTIVKRLLERRDVDGVVMIGAVIKGETLHDEVIAHAIANIAAQLAVQFDKPVALGITGPGMTDEQAAARIDNAKNAVEAVVRVDKVLKKLGD